MPDTEIILITGATARNEIVALWRARADLETVLSNANPQGQH